MKKKAMKVKGFTLVELLVVIAIIGILVALLLPAVQAAREAARRMQCSNNLKQIGLAVLNHHDTFTYFPAGTVSFGNASSTSEWENWAISILPYMEESVLFDQYDLTVPNPHANNQIVAQSHLKAMQCPTDILNDQLIRPASGSTGGFDWAHGSYKAVMGRSRFVDEQTSTYYNDFRVIVGEGAVEVPRAWRGVMHVVTRPKSPNAEQAVLMAGVTGAKARLTNESVKNVTDGTSKTLLVGEYMSNTAPQRAGFWAYTAYGYNEATIIPEMGSSGFMPDYEKCAELNFKAPCQRMFASLHAGGAMNFALTDGSVRTIPDSVDIEILGAMATIEGGETTDLTF